MKRGALWLALLVAAVPCAADSAKLDKKNPAGWLRADAAAFGCFLEQDFGARDKKFNCALKGYKNRGDPCRNVRAYNEGPKFPLAMLGQIDRRIAALELAWEHGQLQAIALTLDGKYAEKEVRSFFALPADASIQDCSLKSTCVVLTGFDHLGAGDVDCPR